MATLKLGTTTAITESGGTVSLDSAVANIPAAGVTGTLPNAVQDNITRLGVQENASSFHISGDHSSGWGQWQNEKVTHFTRLETGGHGHNVGGDYNVSSGHYVVPINGVYCLYLQAYTFWDDNTGQFYWAVDDVIIPNQSDGMYMSLNNTNDMVLNYSQCFTLNADDVVTLRAAGQQSDLHASNSFIGGYLISAT